MALFECALLGDNNDLRLAASSLISAAKLPRLGLVLSALGANALTITTLFLRSQNRPTMPSSCTLGAPMAKQPAQVTSKMDKS